VDYKSSLILAERMGRVTFEVATKLEQRWGIRLRYSQQIKTNSRGLLTTISQYEKSVLRQSVTSKFDALSTCFSTKVVDNLTAMKALST
jgi:hypothetical protein